MRCEFAMLECSASGQIFMAGMVTTKKTVPVTINIVACKNRKHFQNES